MLKKQKQTNNCKSMLMKRVLSILMLFLLVVGANALTQSWIQYFGDNNGFNSIAYTDDDGYIVANSGDNNIIKFNSSNSIEWQEKFGSITNYNLSIFKKIIVTKDDIGNNNYIAVGYAPNGAFGNGDWTGFTGKGGQDAIIVKFDENGDIINKKHFGGYTDDVFNSVAVTKDIDDNDIYVAVGYSTGYVSGGDWTGTNTIGKGGQDAIIVVFDSNLNVLNKYCFGSSYLDIFNDIAIDQDNNYIVAGYSKLISSNTGDWTGTTNKGQTSDATIVKFDGNLNVIGKYNFGGNEDYFNGIAITNDNKYVTVGSNLYTSYGRGDWIGFNPKGQTSSIIVKFNSDLTLNSKQNFGQSVGTRFCDIATINNQCIAVGGGQVDLNPTAEVFSIASFDGNLNYNSHNYFNGHNGGDWFNSICITPSGDFIAAGISYEIISTLPTVIKTYGVIAKYN